MRTIIILCLALLIALSFGCSKKKEEPPKTEPVQVQQDPGKAGQISPTFDVVSKEELDITTAAYSYEYNGVIYYFTSAENMEAFKADPAKYITPAEAPAPATQGQ